MENGNAAELAWGQQTGVLFREIHVERLMITRSSSVKGSDTLFQHTGIHIYVAYLNTHIEI